jgi:hypothetical protein
MKSWHFVNSKLRNGDSVPPDGKWLKYNGPLVMCESGLHGSLEPFDALQYAPGNTLCYVEVRGEMLEQSDKLCCRERKIIARFDAAEMLRYFARMQALSVIHLWEPPDVVLNYLMTGEENIRTAAGDATWDAAWAAARKDFNELIYEIFGVKP